MPAYLSPGIYTRETDFSFYVKQISTSAAAMVGITEKGPVNKPVLVTSWEQFINKFGSYINEGYLAYAARAFFDNGGSILYVCRVAGVTDSDYIGDPSQNTGLYAFDEIDALNLLMVPGVTTVPVINAGIAYAEGRKDLLFIADTPMHLEPLEAIDFRKGQGMYSHAAFNSSYAALYYPWLEIRDPVTARKKYIPPCGAVAGCCARSDQKTYVWCAPAGIDRGRIFNAVSVAYKTSRGERDVLYPEGVNVIAVFPDTGINIWGQKTLQSQPSAVDRINVRRLMMYIEEAISESSRFVVFEPNNPQTWRALGRLINPFLQDIKEKGGLYDYAFQCDEETNNPAVIERNEMIARVFVKPTKTAEFIELNFILTGTGADFSERLFVQKILKPALKGQVEKDDD